MAPELDRARSALSRDSPRAHQAGPATGRGSWCSAHHDGARRALAPGQTREDAGDIFYEELMPCVELAEQLDIKLLIEPEPELLIERFEQYLGFVERLDSP